ncbi:transcriptional regulator, TetR family [Kytococcus aerolatus]|uniref:Transcriptional regulator, TetR family n=2 Tax=Kytococcus aerolatus TaxID=592308 RepID=A0A212TAA8_9MICO|nr:transcriptional regulator, TetR family [Kytococcus aerolatus]
MHYSVAMITPDPVPPASPSATRTPGRPAHRIDGRTTRWDAHRVRRRAELTQAALRAIRRHGPGIGMEEIAAEAGTSRTVLYRHLGDRAGAWRAVIESVDALVWGDMAAASEAAATHPDPPTVIAAITNSYLTLVERDPAIYRFVVTRPLNDTDGDDPVAGMSSRMGQRLTPVMASLLRSSGAASAASPETARTLAHGLVGMVRFVCEDWVGREPRPPREELVAEVAELFGARFDALCTAADGSAPSPATPLDPTPTIARSTR